MKIGKVKVKELNNFWARKKDFLFLANINTNEQWKHGNGISCDMMSFSEAQSRKDFKKMSVYQWDSGLNFRKSMARDWISQ
jgi:hypothetical protein